MADQVTVPGCGHVLIPEIIHHDCSLGTVRVDVYKPDGLPVFVHVEVDDPKPVHKLNVPDLDDVVATLQDSRAAASQALLDRGIRS